MDLWTLLGDIVLLLAACFVSGGIFSRFGQSPLVGYLFAGMVLGGPGSVHLIGSEHEIEAIAELGVALLLFSLGLEFSIRRLRRLGAKPLIGGALQVVLTLAVAAIAAGVCGLSTRPAIAFGVMVSLSSTAVVLRILLERSELDMPHGRNSLAVLLVQDMAVVPLALMMTVLGGDGTTSEILWQIATLLFSAIVLVIGLALVNHMAVLALGTLTLHRNRELTILFATVSGLGAAWAAHSAGVSPALGAFIAGMLLGASAFATQIRADISSLRIVLLTLFFGAAGMVADPLWILQNWYLVAGVALLLTAGKFLVLLCIFIGLGQPTRIAAATGLCLAQVGEFAFVLGSIARANNVISEDLYALVVSVTIVSFFLSAFFVPVAPRFGNWLGRFLRSKPDSIPNHDTEANPPCIVVIGFGPAGEIAIRPLIDRMKNITVIDLNQDSLLKARQLGLKGEVGDATQTDVLEHAALGSAQAVVITIPHFESAMTVLERVRHLAPHAQVFVRSRYQRYTDDFFIAGAHVVTGDEEQVGETLAQCLLHWHEEREIATPTPAVATD